MTAPEPVSGGSGPEVPADVLAWHHEVDHFDGHNDLALRVLEGEDPARPLPDGHLDLPRMRAGGFDGGVFAVWVDPRGEEPLERSLRGVEGLRRYLSETSGFRPVLSSRDLGASADGEVAAVIGVEGGYGITDDLGAVDRLFEAGVRCLTLTWDRPTSWADAAAAEPEHGGLTRFGGRVVDRLRALGIAVDASHASDRVVRDVLARSGEPVLVSHSGLRALCHHPRNLGDDLLADVAESGGVLGVNFFPAYLDAAYGEVFRRLRRERGREALAGRGRKELRRRLEESGVPSVGLERVADHVLHAVDVAGPEAVGLGSDFDGVPSLPSDLRDARDLPRLTAVLASRGLGRTVLEGVLGGNLRRFFRQVLP